MKSVMCNVSYQGVSIAITCVMFLLCGYEYWGPVYMRSHLNSNPTMITASFFFVMSVATILGASTAGYIGDKAGGYRARKALWICFGVYCVMVIATFVAGFCNNEWVYISAFFVMVFTENFVEPIFIGIMMTLVKPHERVVANALSLFIQMAFGYILAPYLYGIIQNSTYVPGDNIDPITG